VATDQRSAEVFPGVTDSPEDAIAGIDTDDDILSVIAGLQTQHPGADALQRQVSVAFDNSGTIRARACSPWPSSRTPSSCTTPPRCPRPGPPR